MVNKDLVIITCCLIVTIICLLVIGFLANELYRENVFQLKTKIVAIKLPPDYRNCDKKNLTETANCLEDYVLTFYSYNISNVGKKLDFATLKREGGVCSSWSELYTQMASELGFYSQDVTIWINESVRHEFSIMSNKEGWCTLDQTNVDCVLLGV